MCMCICTYMYVYVYVYVWVYVYVYAISKVLRLMLLTCTFSDFMWLVDFRYILFLVLPFNSLMFLFTPFLMFLLYSMCVCAPFYMSAHQSLTHCVLVNPYCVATIGWTFHSHKPRYIYICKCKHHTKCVRLDKATDISSNWYCPPCIQTVLPFNHLDEDDDFCSAVFEESLNCSFRFHAINNRIFSPFEINQDLDTPFSEIDPDLQFYTETNYIQNMKCDYHIEDSFNDLFSCKKEDNACASFFHLNIKSLSKPYDDLCIILESLSLRFSFVAITETWLSDHTNELYGMPNYNMESRYRKCKKDGGVALYVNDSIPYTVRQDLEFLL